MFELLLRSIAHGNVHRPWIRSSGCYHRADFHPGQDPERWKRSPATRSLPRPPASGSPAPGGAPGPPVGASAEALGCRSASLLACFIQMQSKHALSCLFPSVQRYMRGSLCCWSLWPCVTFHRLTIILLTMDRQAFGGSHE